MERAKRYVATNVAAHQLEDALAHLARCLVSEGDGQDAARVDSLVGNEVGDAVGDDARLAAAGPGQDEERSLRDFDRFSLSRIQPAEYVHPPSRRHSSTALRGHSTTIGHAAH